MKSKFQLDEMALWVPEPSPAGRLVTIRGVQPARCEEDVRYLIQPIERPNSEPKWISATELVGMKKHETE